MPRLTQLSLLLTANKYKPSEGASLIAHHGGALAQGGPLLIVGRTQNC